jgi:hypothetical protein
MTSALSHDDLSRLALNQVTVIGETYGRLIFQKAVLFQLELDDTMRLIEDAADDLRDYLLKNGTCENDVSIALGRLRLAIVQEGRRLTDLLPDILSETVQ